MKITLLNGKDFDYQSYCGFNLKVIKNSKIKKLSLRIDEKLHLPVLNIPQNYSHKKVLSFIDAHHDWIINSISRLPDICHFQNGNIFSFFGQEYTLIHAPENKTSKFENNTLKICGDIEFLHRRTTDFLKKQTLQKLSDLSIKIAKSIDCKISHLSIKDTKSRWGSCSTSGKICYNWRICMAPIGVINYLVCHEISHLKHPNHSADFWNCVQSLCPNYKEMRRWLKSNGKTLYKYA